MIDWYDSLEPEIRPWVKLLRDNGWNTLSSCGHNMTIQIDLQHLDQVEILARFLSDNGVQEFSINAYLENVKGGLWKRWLEVKIVKALGVKDE